MYRFEKLSVYHDAMDLLEEVYKLTKQLPKEETSNLCEQLKKSSSQVVLYITEGINSLGETDFRSYLKHSLRCLCDTVVRIKMAERLFEAEVEPVLKKCDEVETKLHALIKTLMEERRFKRIPLKTLPEESVSE